jgi:hypothetical protein
LSPRCRDAIGFQSQVLKRRVVFNGFLKPGERVVAHERFGFALAVREDAVVAGIHRCVVEARTNFGSLSVSQEVHHIAFAPEVTFEDSTAQLLIDEVEHFHCSRMHGNGPGFPARARHALDASILDTAACQFHRQHAPDGASPDDKDGDFIDFGHICLSLTSPFGRGIRGLIIVQGVPQGIF